MPQLRLRLVQMLIRHTGSEHTTKTMTNSPAKQGHRNQSEPKKAA